MTTTTTYHFSSEPLIQSCPLPKSMITHKGRDHSSLTITAAKVEPLSALLKRNKKHLEYQVVEQLIESIGRQLQFLERENKGISGFNIDDITVFYAAATPSTSSDAAASDNSDNSDNSETDDDSATQTAHFAITNDDKIHDINDKNNLVIMTPYPKEKTRAFHSPELTEFLSKKTLPYEIHFKSGYYSFGLLCLHCYVSRSATAATDDAALATTAALATIINTKIYWFLKQVLQEDPTERRYICV
jgi:hypothetical protein